VTARDASKLNKTWNDDMYSKSLKASSDTLTASGADLDNYKFISVPPSVAVKDSGADKACDETKKCADCVWLTVTKLYSNTGTTVNTKALCYQACQEYNVDKSVGIGIKSGNYYGPNVLAGAKICMGASFTTGTSACALYTVIPKRVNDDGGDLKGTTLAGKKLLVVKSSNVGFCQSVMTPSESKTVDKGNAVMPFWAKAWYTWYDKYKLAMPTVATWDNMKTEADAQAELEKKWLAAWYYQQFWAKMVVQLTTTHVRTSRAKNFNDWEKGALGAGLTDKLETSQAGSASLQTDNNTALENARNKLAMLTSKHTAAVNDAARVADQILNTTEQIADMSAMIKDRTGLGTIASPLVLGGELAELKFKRNADWEVYGKANTGLKAKTAKAKLDADNALLAGTSKKDAQNVVTWTGEGPLKKAEREAQEKWTAA
jgi:hypothetical protein